MAAKRAKKENATKKTIVMLTEQQHLRLKVLAAMSKCTFGEFIQLMMDRFEQGKKYSVEDDIFTLELIEKQNKDAQAEAKASGIPGLEIQQEAR